MVLLFVLRCGPPVPEALVTNIWSRQLVYSIGMWWLAVGLVLGGPGSKLIRV